MKYHYSEVVSSKETKEMHTKSLHILYKKDLKYQYTFFKQVTGKDITILANKNHIKIILFIIKSY